MADIDHRTMTPPYIRKVSEHSSGGGSPVTVWDLRVGQANVSYMSTAAAHSIEHMLSVELKAEDPSMLLVAPMGCLTGFYIVTVGDHDEAQMIDLLDRAADRAAARSEVPLANIVECGNALCHTLEGAVNTLEWLRSREHVLTECQFKK